MCLQLGPPSCLIVMFLLGPVATIFDVCDTTLGGSPPNLPGARRPPEFQAAYYCGLGADICVW